MSERLIYVQFKICVQEKEKSFLASLYFILIQLKHTFNVDQHVSLIFISIIFLIILLFLLRSYNFEDVPGNWDGEMTETRNA